MPLLTILILFVSAWFSLGLLCVALCMNAAKGDLAYEARSGEVALPHAA